jgi:multiple sugar transport system ATP-binding protein
MARVQLKGIDKVYPGGFQAVYGADIDIKDKEFVVLVGPSGCGKSTTLRMIAGLEEISGGELFIDEKMVNTLPPKDRDIAMVFQNYALYPHMTVFENMAFGLKIRKFPKGEIDKRVTDAAKILHIEDQLLKKPKALSGGQRQRVAMGRAIVRKPKVFLFDEPLSNLDAKLRVTMRAEISRLHSRLQTTVVYVTHDQVEAMTLGDRIVVMKDGYIQQIDSPLNLYNNPSNKFVAGFIGSPPMNFILCDVKEEKGKITVTHGDFSIHPSKEQQDKLKEHVGKKVTFGVRPEDLVAKIEGDNKIKAVVDVVEPLGAEIYVYVSTVDGSQLVARLEPNVEFHVGQDIELGVSIDKCHFFEHLDKAEKQKMGGNVVEKCII